MYSSAICSSNNNTNYNKNRAFKVNAEKHEFRQGKGNDGWKPRQVDGTKFYLLLLLLWYVVVAVFFLTGPLWSHFKTFVFPPSKLIPSRKFSAALGNSNTHIYREKGSEARSPIKRIFQKRIEEQQQQKIRQNPLLRRRNTQIKLNSDIWLHHNDPCPVLPVYDSLSLSLSLCSYSHSPFPLGSAFASFHTKKLETKQQHGKLSNAKRSKNSFKLLHF